MKSTVFNAQFKLAPTVCVLLGALALSACSTATQTEPSPTPSNLAPTPTSGKFKYAGHWDTGGVKSTHPTTTDGKPTGIDPVGEQQIRIVTVIATPNENGQGQVNTSGACQDILGYSAFSFDSPGIISTQSAKVTVSQGDFGRPRIETTLDVAPYTKQG